jgi:PAS domain S-box-containing protein
MLTDLKPLRVLIAEDSQNDALLLGFELERAGYAPTIRRVETREAMIEALTRERWDLIIADYVMPSFGGLEALALVREQQLDIPFIIVSGHITDDTAVAAMKAGAHDYVMKDNLARLGSAVKRELSEAEVRAQRRRSEQSLKTELTLREAIESSVPAGISVVAPDGKQTYVNRAFCQMVGWSRQELLGAYPPFRYWPEDREDAVRRAFNTILLGTESRSGLELRFQHRDGRPIDVLMQATPLKDAEGQIAGWVSSVSDITERKRAEARLAMEHTVTRLLAQAGSLADAAPELLRELLTGLDLEVGVLWLRQNEGRWLFPGGIELRDPALNLGRFVKRTRKLSLEPGKGLPGKVLEDRRPSWVSDLSHEREAGRRAVHRAAGLQSAVAFPIQSSDSFFGVVEMLSRRRLEPQEAWLNMMNAIGSEIGQFIERRSAEAALRRAHDELEARVRQRTAQLQLANERLEAAIQERRRLEHELLDITERERRRIALDLHDDLGQKLSGIALMAKGLELRLSRVQKEAAQEASRIHRLIQEAMSHASGLAHDLADLEFKTTDLPAALEKLTWHARGLYSIRCTLRVSAPMPKLEAGTVRQLYKIAQEALTNAIKHGKAKNIAVGLANTKQALALTVTNDGQPFPDLESRSTGMGLRIMNYRAHLVGATLTVKSLGKNGTRVSCLLPLSPA